MTEVEVGSDVSGRVRFYDFPSMRSGRLVMGDTRRLHFIPDRLKQSRDLGIAARLLMVPVGSYDHVRAPAARVPQREAIDSKVSRAVTRGFTHEVELILRHALGTVLDDWFAAGAHQASMRQAAKHSSFALLRKANPLAVEMLVERLRRDPNPLWVWALGELTGEDPAAGAETVADATRAWTEWADERGVE